MYAAETFGDNLKNETNTVDHSFQCGVYLLLILFIQAGLLHAAVATILPELANQLSELGAQRQQRRLKATARLLVYRRLSWTLSTKCREPPLSFSVCEDYRYL